MSPARGFSEDTEADSAQSLKLGTSPGDEAGAKVDTSPETLTRSRQLVRFAEVVEVSEELFMKFDSSEYDGSAMEWEEDTGVNVIFILESIDVRMSAVLEEAEQLRVAVKGGPLSSSSMMACSLAFFCR
jgi:hypothetical protein